MANPKLMPNTPKASKINDLRWLTAILRKTSHDHKINDHR